MWRRRRCYDAGEETTLRCCGGEDDGVVTVTMLRRGDDVMRISA